MNDVSEEIISCLAEVRKNSKEHFRNKDVDKFMSMYSDDLEYKQANGKIISKAQLTKDVQSQLNLITDFGIEHTQESIKFVNELVIEKSTQTITATVPIFLFFKKKWKVYRQSIFTWKKIKNQWHVCKVEVLKEDRFA